MEALPVINEKSALNQLIPIFQNLQVMKFVGGNYCNNPLHRGTMVINSAGTL